MKFRRMQKPPAQWVADLWLEVWKLRDKLPWGLGMDMTQFVDFVYAPDACIYEVGDFQGVVFFTNIREQVEQFDDALAFCHVLMWDSIYMYRHKKPLRALLADFFRTYNVHRVYGEIPASVRLNLFLGQGLGFTKVGTLRKRIPRPDGQWEDAILVDILREDVEEDHGIPMDTSGNRRSRSNTRRLDELERRQGQR